MTDQSQPDAEPAGETDVTDEGDARVMGLLSEHVPLSLLVDLADPEGPASDEILQAEGKPEDAWWVQEGTEDGEPAGAAPADEAPSERA